MLSVEQCASLACLLEVSVPKPGNVHRGADFEDLTFIDFVLSAVAIGPVMGRASKTCLGKTVLDAVRATSAATKTNTNLGIILLLAPLASIGREANREQALQKFLGGLDADDATNVYAAIRLAKPGGLGSSAAMDVHDAAPTDLLAAMNHAKDRDAVALQYVTNFQRVQDFVAPSLRDSCRKNGFVEGVLEVYLTTLWRYPDSLVARKCGEQMSVEVAHRARFVLDAGDAGSVNRHHALADFDFWLRADGHRRNPGTTADFITAGLFLGLLDNQLSLDSLPRSELGR